MAKVKNRRDNHAIKRPKSSAGYGETEGTQRVRSQAPKPDAKKAKAGTTKTAKKSASNSGEYTRKIREDFSPKGQSKVSGGNFKDGKFKAFRGENSASESEANKNIIFGRNPVTEALKSGREIDKILVTSREGSIIKILAMAKEKGIPVMYVEKAALDRISDGQAHQGVAAYTSPYAYSTMDDVFKRAEEAGEDPFIMILDGIEDPHNLGAIMRTAECAGAHGIIIPKRHASGLTEVVAKSSAGAIEYMPVVKVTNIAQTIDELKAQGIWVFACDMGDTAYYESDMSGKVAIVIGSEGFGISKLVKEKCDHVVSMPMVGKITSLNASNAAAVVMYEVRRQRNLKK